MLLVPSDPALMKRPSVHPSIQHQTRSSADFRLFLSSTTFQTILFPGSGVIVRIPGERTNAKYRGDDCRTPRRYFPSLSLSLSLSLSPSLSLAPLYNSRHHRAGRRRVLWPWPACVSLLPPLPPPSPPEEEGALALIFGSVLTRLPAAATTNIKASDWPGDRCRRKEAVPSLLLLLSERERENSEEEEREIMRSEDPTSHKCCQKQKRPQTVN